jgi:hypothetical protein
MSNEQLSPGPVKRLVGRTFVFMKLFILPFMAVIELLLLALVFIVGIIKPQLGLKLNDLICDKLPSRDWYWEMKINVRSSRLPNAPRSLEAPGDQSAGNDGDTRSSVSDCYIRLMSQ